MAGTDTRPILSILICSVDVRHLKLNRLLCSFETQLNADPGLWDEVEVIRYIDDGAAPLIVKYVTLINQARGRYFIFVDDDDEVSPTFCRTMVRVLKQAKNTFAWSVAELISAPGAPDRRARRTIRYDDAADGFLPYSFRCPTPRGPLMSSPVSIDVTTTISQFEAMVCKHRLTVQVDLPDDVFYRTRHDPDLSLASPKLPPARLAKNIENQHLERHATGTLVPVAWKLRAIDPRLTRDVRLA